MRWGAYIDLLPLGPTLQQPRQQILNLGHRRANQLHRWGVLSNLELRNLRGLQLTLRQVIRITRSSQMGLLYCTLWVLT